MPDPHSLGLGVAQRAVAILALAMCSCLCLHESLAAAMAPALSVEITKFSFQPREITVAPGTKIIWTNHDEVPHTVTSADKSFASMALDTDDRFEHTFMREGDFQYYCVVHPYMTGVVHVRTPQLP
ncbi:MAG: cupredoxin family copper-binding protein [Thiobacillaceae bacterium]